MKKFNVSNRAKVVLRGLLRMAWGALTAVLVYMAVRLLVSVQSCDGYWAVGQFVVAVCELVLAGLNVYDMGKDSRKAGKYEAV